MLPSSSLLSGSGHTGAEGVDLLEGSVSGEVEGADSLNELPVTEVVNLALLISRALAVLWRWFLLVFYAAEGLLSAMISSLSHVLQAKFPPPVRAR